MLKMDFRTFIDFCVKRKKSVFSADYIRMNQGIQITTPQFMCNILLVSVF